MSVITTVEELEAIYGTPRETSMRKEVAQLNTKYRELIGASPFFAFATVGPDGLDCSPRGDRGTAVTIEDDSTLLIPDRKGNNRIDSLRNIVTDPRVALLFLIPGHDVSLRINGTASISVAEDLIERFVVDGSGPRSVVKVHIETVYFQCARALMRSELWSQSAHVDPSSLPTCGQILEEITSGDMRAADYDPDLYERLREQLF